MTMKKIVAHEIFKVREEVGIDGTAEHDWWLADKFLQFIGKDRWKYDDIYIWFLQLDENMAEKQNQEEDFYG